MTGKKPIVKIRVYRGSEMNYDASGKVKNENFLISVEHGTNLWKLTMKNLRLNGYCKVDVDSVWDLNKNGDYIEREDTGVIKKEVKNTFEFEKVIKLTPDQERIAKLEAMIEKLTKGQEDEVEEDVEDVSELDKARQEYEKLFEKKVFHGWSIEQLREKIQQKK